MKTFITLDDDQYETLRRRATGRCIRYPDLALPPGSRPCRGQVGFEVRDDGSAALLVQAGVAYRGDDDEVRTWLATGRREFDSFESMRDWIRGPLAAAFAGGQEPGSRDRAIPGLRPWGPTPRDLPLFGYDELLEQAEAVLEQQAEPSAVLLVGPHGVGKTAIARALAGRWADRSTAHRCLRAETAGLLAGAGSAIERSARLESVFRQVVPNGMKTLLVLETLDLACGSLDPRRGETALDDAFDDGPDIRRLPMPAFEDPYTEAVFGSWLERGLRCCATTTPAGLRSITSAALRRRLHVIEVAEPTRDDVRHVILPGVVEELSRRHGVAMVPEALHVAIERGSALGDARPGNVIRWLDYAMARARARGIEVLTPDDVIDG